MEDTDDGWLNHLSQVCPQNKRILKNKPQSRPATGAKAERAQEEAVSDAADYKSNSRPASSAANRPPSSSANRPPSSGGTGTESRPKSAAKQVENEEK